MPETRSTNSVCSSQTFTPSLYTYPIFNSLNPKPNYARPFHYMKTAKTTPSPAIVTIPPPCAKRPAAPPVDVAVPADAVLEELEPAFPVALAFEVEEAVLPAFEVATPVAVLVELAEFVPEPPVAFAAPFIFVVADSWLIISKISHKSFAQEERTHGCLSRNSGCGKGHDDEG